MNACIIQARMGSTRLPGKVLATISGETILSHCVRRIRPSEYTDVIVIATTTLPEDDAIAAESARIGVPCYRGSDWDVLDRYYQAALSLPEKPDYISRVCSDNPLHHHAVVDQVFRDLFFYRTDYWSNGNEPPDFIEDGFTAEAFTFAALEMAHQHASALPHREHVTPFIKRSAGFSRGWRKVHADYQFKLSVDTAADLEAVTGVIAAMGGPGDYGIGEITRVIQERPELMAPNDGFIRSESYPRVR